MKLNLRNPAVHKPGLLDINVLIALIDPAHEFHSAAHAWFQSNKRNGWATCPITENGCLRILSKPGYPFPGLTVPFVRDILARLAGLTWKSHRFWPDSISILESNQFRTCRGRPEKPHGSLSVAARHFIRRTSRHLRSDDPLAAGDGLRTRRSGGLVDAHVSELRVIQGT